MRIGVDAMGGDHGPAEAVPGAVEAARLLDVPVTLFGQREAMEGPLSAVDTTGVDVMLRDCREVIETAESPIQAIRQKKDSSMVQGFRALRDGEIDAFVSAGNTGALVAGGSLIVGMMTGLRRPGLATTLPTVEMRPMVLVDAGASVDPKPQQLAEYAVVGSIYAEEILKRENPRVGLVNIGVEEEKGNELTRRAYALLRNAPIRFVGNIEARELVSGDVDVAVADGFVGNVILKLAEGFGLGMFHMIQEEIRQTFWSRIGGLLVRPRLRRLKTLVDYASYGGAPLFGPTHPVIKCHGSSRREAIKNGVRVAHDFVTKDVIHRMELRLQELADRA